VLLGGLAISAGGFLLYPFVHEAWQAIAVAVLFGAGGGTWLTMQAALLAGITPSEKRPQAFAQQRVAANIGLGLGGFVGGSIVTVSRPSTFTILFLLNAASFVAYGLFLLRIRSTARVENRVPGSGYRAVARDRAFVRLLALNFAFVIGAIALLNSLFPVFAKNQAGVSERTIGTMFLLNSLTIIVLQLPIAKLTLGRRRMRSLALMACLFATCWTLVAVAAGLSALATVLVLALAIGVLSVGECIYDSVYGPLVPALAPPHLLGRYMAASGFSWQLGFIVGPAVGATVLALHPHALWPAAVVVCLGAAVACLRAERVLPPEARRSPLPALDSGRGPEDSHRSLRRRHRIDRARREPRS
jgi:MFS family permease